MLNLHQELGLFQIAPRKSMVYLVVSFTHDEFVSPFEAEVQLGRKVFHKYLRI